MIKLNSFLLAAICCSTLTVLGQSKIEIGAQGSPGMTFMRGNEFLTKYHSPAIGFSGGVTFQFNFKKILSLHTSLSYERKGSVMKNQPFMYEDGSKSTLTIHLHYDYLTMPILVRASFGERVQFFINAGPYFGYLLQTGYAVRSAKENYTDNPYFKKWDMGVSTGLGVTIPFGEKIAGSLELRNNLGLYNINNSPYSLDETMKTNSTNLLIGMAYRIGS